MARMTGSKNIGDLVRLLEKALVAPQKSERWCIYRIVLPVVDYAIEEMNVRAFFEYNQTSRHRQSQSVDIALLGQDERPVLVVEAKGIERTISSDEVTRYLIECSRGVVSNGVEWCLRDENFSSRINLVTEDLRHVDTLGLEAIIAFIRGKNPNWVEGQQKLLPRQKNVDRPKKTEKAERKSQPVTVLKDPQECLMFVQSLPRLSPLDRLFVQMLCEKLRKFSPKLRCEGRSTRLVFFESVGQSRLLRIEFGKREPSIILKTSLVDENLSLSERETSSPHNKHAGFREFRPSSSDQVEKLANAFAKILSAINKGGSSPKLGR